MIIKEILLVCVAKINFFGAHTFPCLCLRAAVNYSTEGYKGQTSDTCLTTDSWHLDSPSLILCPGSQAFIDYRCNYCFSLSRLFLPFGWPSCVFEKSLRKWATRLFVFFFLFLTPLFVCFISRSCSSCVRFFFRGRNSMRGHWNVDKKGTGISKDV